MRRDVGPLEYEVREGRRWQRLLAGRWRTALLVVGLAIGGLGIVIKLMAPRPREEPNWLVCNSHMKQIGSAILLYSNENQGHYPDRLGQLLPAEDISADVFVCPATEDDYARGPTTQAVVDVLTAGGHLSYLYVGAGLRNDCDPDTVVLYEPMANHGGAGMNVLFGDGHVEFLRPGEAREIVDRVGAGERPVVWTRGGGK